MFFAKSTQNKFMVGTLYSSVLQHFLGQKQLKGVRRNIQKKKDWPNLILGFYDPTQALF
jgi:hypothetical protein